MLLQYSYIIFYMINSLYNHILILLLLFLLHYIDTPSGFRAGIVHAIAEKVNSTFVGLYDADAYQQL